MLNDFAGAKGCRVCKQGWVMESEQGCVDVDECAIGTHKCINNEFCVNNEGSFECLSKELLFNKIFIFFLPLQNITFYLLLLIENWLHSQNVTERVMGAPEMGLICAISVLMAMNFEMECVQVCLSMFSIKNPSMKQIFFIAFPLFDCY